MAMAVCRCNVKCITQCSMSRAISEATGCQHWATTCSVLPQRLPGQQQTKQGCKNTPTLLAVLMAMAMCQYVTAYHPMEEVQGFTRSSWTPPLGKYLLQWEQLVMLTQVIFECFHDQLIENKHEAKGWPRIHGSQDDSILSAKLIRIAPVTSSF